MLGWRSISRFVRITQVMLPQYGYDRTVLFIAFDLSLSLCVFMCVLVCVYVCVLVLVPLPMISVSLHVRQL